MLAIIAGLVLILYVGIAWVIVKAYRQTHNAGFLIIGCAVLLWPLVGGLFSKGMLAITSGQVTQGWMIAFSIYAYQAIHAGLLLIGLLTIIQSLNGARASVASGTER